MFICSSWKLVSSASCGLLVASVATAAWADVAIESKHEVKIDKSKPYPSILYSDILKSMQDPVAWKKGKIRMFKRVRMTFLPDFKDPKHVAAYNSSSGARLAHKLTDAKGKVIDTVLWQARKLKHPFWNASPVSHSPTALKPGRYTYTWYVEGQPFWSVDFKVVKQAPKDAYGEARYYFEGPWNKAAYIYIPRGNTRVPPTLSIFIRNKKSVPGKEVRSSITAEIRRNGKLVAHKPGKSTVMMHPWWERYDISLRSPKNPRRPMKAASIVKKNGRYKVTVKIDGKRYGVWTYRVRGGKIPFSNRKGTKPLDFLEGGRDRFYLKRVR